MQNIRTIEMIENHKHTNLFTCIHSTSHNEHFECLGCLDDEVVKLWLLETAITSSANNVNREQGREEEWERKRFIFLICFVFIVIALLLDHVCVCVSSKLMLTSNDIQNERK